MTRREMQEREIPTSASPRFRPERISVEIHRDKLLELLRARHLCAADITCLDCDAKDCVWRLALAACGSGSDVSGR